jgi:Ca-activated chloride channel family protein
MTDSPFDPTLDSQLNEVAVPAGFVPRLLAIAGLGDDEVDARELDVRLRDVSIPAGLEERLCDVVADEALDARLRGIPIPVSVLARTHNIPYLRRRSQLGQWALAASLMAMVGAGMTGLLGVVVSSVRLVEPLPPALMVVDQGPLDIVSPVESAVTIVPEADDGRWRTSLAGLSDETMRLLTTFDRPQRGPAGQLAEDIGKVWNPWDNWLLMRWGALGYVPTADAVLPELNALTAPAAQGMEAPLVRGYDREFLYSRGVQPLTLTAFDPAARGLDVPLATCTDSIDRIRQLAAAGRLPPPELVRAEDFLAAVQPHSGGAADSETLAIRTAGGPSVFNRSEAGLLQVSVHAGLSPKPASHLVLAIDTSASMSWDGGLDAVRSAVTGILPYLGPQDRLSVLMFHREITEVVREIRRDDRAELDQLAAVLEHVGGAGGANLGAALQQAISLAIESETGVGLPCRLVLITASRPLLARAEAEGVRQMFAEAAKGDFRFEVCDLTRDESSHAAWLELAGQAACTVRRPPSADQLRWALVEALTGNTSVAATEVKLRVEFNPRAVAAYRLIGHESTAFGGLLPASVETDLRAGQAASALFEIWLYPNEEDDVATVRVQWTDPGKGKTRQAGPQRVSRVQFATAFEGAALSLQAAAVAAEAAEVLKQAFNFRLIAPDRYGYEPKPSGLAHVLIQARHVAPGLANQPQFRRFVALLEVVSRQESSRSAASARSGTRGIIGDQWSEYGLK